MSLTDVQHSVLRCSIECELELGESCLKLGWRRALDGPPCLATGKFLGHTNSPVSDLQSITDGPAVVVFQGHQGRDPLFGGALQ